MNKLIKGKTTNELIEEFTPRIRYWAHYYHPKSSQVIEEEDLVIIGMMGLMDAIKKYDPKRLNQFKTYAEFRIRGEMIDELRRMDWLSRSDRKKQKLIAKETQVLSQNLGRTPTHEELNNILPFKKEDQVRLLNMQEKAHVSYDEETRVINLRETVNSDLMRRMEWREILTHLPYNMKRILELKYQMDYNFSEIAETLKLSEGRISQLHTEALANLKLFLTEDDINLLIA